MKNYFGGVRCNFTVSYHKGEKTMKGTHTNVNLAGKFLQKSIRCRPEDTSALAQGMPIFADALMRLGLNVPQIIKLERTDGGLSMVCEDAGTDLEKLLAVGTKGQRKGLFRRIIEELGKILPATVSDSLELLVGFDPKPANFCIDENGVISYVDLMPPFDRGLDGRPAYVDYPPPKEKEEWKFCYWRGFTQDGVLTILFTRLQRFFEREEVLEELGPVLSEMSKRVQESIAYQMAFDFTPTDARAEKITALRWPWDLYRARSIARLLGKEIGEEVHARTRPVASLSPRATLEGFQAVKKFLLDSLPS